MKGLGTQWLRQKLAFRCIKPEMIALLKIIKKTSANSLATRVDALATSVTNGMKAAFTGLQFNMAVA